MQRWRAVWSIASYLTEQKFKPQTLHRKDEHVIARLAGTCASL